MVEKHAIALKTLVEEFRLEVIYPASDYDRIHLTVEDVARPGLQLAGFFDHFEPVRLQVLGNVEMSFLKKMDVAHRLAAFDSLFSYRIPALLISRNEQVDEACLVMAKKHDVTILRTGEPTSAVISAIITYLKDALAPRITRHGVFMEVYGEGILVTGESGLGKSETAVELMKRGHRLIADDAVEIRRISGNILMGKAPAVVRNFMELRGIGIINVAKLYGMGAVKEENQIDLVVQVEPWSNTEVYDRIGLEQQWTQLLGVNVPINVIPITPGRNLAVILEVAAMNNRHRKMGYNAAMEFTEQINQQFDRNMGMGL